MSDWAVEVQNLTVKFGDFKAVDDVSFQVGRGEIFGFLGANGAGKTTTIRVLCGLLAPTAGTARVAGLGFEKEGGVAIKNKVGYMSQRLTIYQDMSVEENLAFCAALRKMDAARLEARSRELLDFIAFKVDRKTLVQDLPGGLKQEVSLVAAMLHDPEIVFLDEPTAGVAPASRQRFWNLIQKLAAAGKTVFVTTHYMDEAEQCGRIALMRDGRIIALDSPEGLKKQAFPLPMLELSSAQPLTQERVEALKKDPLVGSFLPHGMRWHLEPSSAEAWKTLQPKLGKDVEVREIKPGLEDVFLRLVEGGKS
jgi:ABC-2 type transport system ATP-binding protein